MFFERKKKKGGLTSPSIHLNYIYNLIYQVLTLLTPLITTPYISRVIGPDGTGVQSYTNSIVQYFAIVAALGTTSYGQREIARHRDDQEMRSRLFWEIEILCAITTSICLAVWAGVILFSETYTYFYLVLTMNLMAAAFDISWFFGGLEQYGMIVTRNIIVKLTGIVCLFAFIKEKEDLLLYVALLAATTLFGNMSMWGYLKRFLTKVDIHSLRIKRHLKETIVYFIPTVATSVYTILDKTMLGWFTGNDKSQNGYYEYAAGIVNMGKVLIVSFNTVMSSRMSYLFAEKKRQEIQRMIEASVDFVLLIGMPVMMGLAGIASEFIPWFLGDAYRPVAALLYVCSPLILIVGFSDCMGSQILTPSGKRAQSGKVIVAGAVINAFLNRMMIPRFQAAGASIASVIAEIFITGAYLWLCRDYIRFSVIWKSGWKRCLAAVFMFFFVVWLGTRMDTGPAATFVQIGAGAVLYFAVLFVMRDKFLVRQLWKK